MKFRKPLYLLILLLFGLQHLSSQQASVMTFNIRLDVASDEEDQWSFRKAELVDFLKKKNADFIGLQEAMFHQRTYIDSSLPNYNQIGVGRDDGKDKGEATPIFYNSNKFRLLDHNTIWLSNTPNVVSKGWDASYERICTYGLFKHIESKKKLWVFNTHFDHRGEKARVNSASLILKKITELTGEYPVVLLGDFNATPESDVYTTLSRKLKDSWIETENIYGPSGTWNGFNPNLKPDRRIDYVFFRNCSVNFSEHLNQKRNNGRCLSDHLSVYADIEFLPCESISRNGFDANQSDSNRKLDTTLIRLSRDKYYNQLQGFWLGQCIANWTGLVTEMDKIGDIGDITTGAFYTREDWGKPDQPSIWGEGVPSDLSETIDFVIRDTNEIWGADDDTDIEYMYQHLLYKHNTSILNPKQIRDGWLKHIRTEEENFLWVSNQRAFELMMKGVLPPVTSLQDSNVHYEMIDAQLTTEIFGLFAPCNPTLALKMAYLPIRTTARENAAWISEFYVYMHAIASAVDPQLSKKQQILWMANKAKVVLPANSYSRKMYEFVKSKYDSGISWEQARDSIYQRYQVEQKDGYMITSKNLYCNGCFAAGINFAASLVSLFYGEGDLKETIKIAVLTGWDSDNPAATWGGLLGFMYGKQAIEETFKRKFSDQFNIHRTRQNFPNDGIDNFGNMAKTGIFVIDRVVSEEMSGRVDMERNEWLIPLNRLNIETNLK